MKYTLIIKTKAEKSYSALNFAKASIQLNHQITAVFFYQQAASLANKLIDLPQDEISIQNCWGKFAEQNSIELLVCSGSAARYGVPTENFAPNFKLSSLGQLTEIIDSTDRVITF